MKKDLNYYLKLPWTFHFEWDDKDNCYVASVTELLGCMSDGETMEEAINMIKDALREYIETFLELGKKIPEPAKKETYKGKILVRTTPEKHYKLVKKASSQGKSLNKLLDEIINKEIA